jgi:hypothetical protein
MQEVHARAQLVAIDEPGLSTRKLSAVIPRSEIEEVIGGGEFPARLVVAVGRADDETRDVTAHAQLAVDWAKPDLEELLRRAGDSDLELSFDADEVQRALDDADVEGHGMRERVAVLGIVVATAGATAGGAFAHTQLLDGGGSGATTSHATSSFITDVRGGTGGATAGSPAFITDVQGGTGGATAAPETGAPSFITDVQGGTGGATAAPETGAPSFITDVQGGTGGATAAPETGAPSFITDVQGGTGGATAAPETGAPSFITDVQGGTGGATAAPETGAPSFITDVQGGTGSPVTVSSDGTGISLPSAADTAGLAGLALVLTGAGFVAVRSRREPHLPA